MVMCFRAKKPFYGYAVTAAGFMVWFIGWGTYTPSFSVFLKPLLAEYGWSRADASLAYSLSFLVLGVLGVVMGYLTDRLGPRIVVAGLGSMLGVCYLLLSQIENLWQFQAVYAVLGGVGVSTLTTPVMVTVSRWFARKRATMIGIVQAGMGIGGFLFPPLAGWLIISYGWRTAYAALGVIALVGLVAAGLFLRRDPQGMGQLPDGAVLMVAPQQPQDGEDPAAGFSLRQALRAGGFWIVVALFCTFGFCRSAFLAHLAAHVQDVGYTLADGANVVALLVGASMFGRIGMGSLADRIGNRTTFVISFAMTTGSLVLGLVTRDLMGLYLFAFIFGVAWGNQAVLRFSLASEVFGLGSLGTIVGVLNFFESAAATVGSYLAGWIFDTSGSYGPVFWIGIGVSVAGAVLAWVVKPLHRAVP